MKKLLLLNLLILSACANNGEFKPPTIVDLLVYMNDPNGDKQKIQQKLQEELNAIDAENNRIQSERTRQIAEEIKKNFTSIQVVEQCTASARVMINSAWNGANGFYEQMNNLEAIGENYYKTKGIRVSTFYSNVEKIEKAYYTLIPRNLVEQSRFRNPREEKQQYANWAQQYIFPKAMEKYQYFSCVQKSYGDYIR